MKSHWLKNVKSLWLREKLYFKFYARKKNILDPRLFQEASLEFAPDMRLTLCPTDIAHKQIALTGCYELSVSRKIAALARKGGLLVDVGANYGYYSLMWAGTLPGNRVIAFEASHLNSTALDENGVRNGAAGRIQIFDLAVGKQQGRMPFGLGPVGETGWGGLSLDDPGLDEVEVVTLDEVMSKKISKQIEVLKIDVEGADAWVLEGARDLLKNHSIAHIFFEENNERMKKLNIAKGETQKIVVACGYRLQRLSQEEWYAHL